MNADKLSCLASWVLEPKTSFINLFVGLLGTQGDHRLSVLMLLRETYYFGAAFKIVFQNAVE